MITSRTLLLFGLAVAIATTSAVLFVSLATSEKPHALVGANSPEPDKPLQAVAYRSQKRLSQQGNIPDGALRLALSQRESLVEISDAGGVFPGGWTWYGPGNIGGRVRSLIIHPTNTSIMWTGGLSGGIWKTLDGGANWFPLDDFMPVMPIGCMAIDPTNPDVLFAGTGEGFFETLEGSSNTAAVRGSGIFKTVDGGTTWVQISSTNTPDWYFVNRLAIHPTNSQIIVAATATGIWRTTNGGASWAKVFNDYAYDVQFHPSDSTKLVAGLHDTGVIRSNDTGQTWALATGLSGVHRSEVRYAPSSPTTVYCAASAGSRIKIYRSTNAGASFSLMTTGTGISTYAGYNNVLWVDPVNSANLILGGVNLFRSSNSGATFAQGFGGVHADMHAIVSDPGFNGTTNRRIYFGCDGGIYRANDHTVNTVSNLNHNLGITQFYGAVMNPANNQIVGGTQDNGTMRYTGNPQGWSSIFGGDGVYCDYDPTDVNYWYGGIYYAQIFRSTTGGPSGSYIYNGILDAGSSTTCNFIAYFGLDPNNANTMLVGARSLWRSTNVKAATPTWTAIKPTIQPGGAPIPPPNSEAHFAANPPWNASTFAVAQGNSNIIWVGYNKGEVWKTSNGTAGTPTWARVDNGSTQLPARWVGSIRIDPNNHNRVIVAFMGYDPDNLWETTDGGATWTDISGNLPSAPISAITTHPNQSNWLYAGTDVGLFTSSDGGQNWSTQNVGPGIAPVEELRWVTSTKLLAVTHGRGIYSADIPDNVTEPLSPTSYTVIIGQQTGGKLSSLFGSDDNRLIVQGEFLSVDAAYPVGVQFRTVSPHASLSTLKIKVESSSSEAQLGQRTLLLNRLANSWEEVDFRLSTLGDTSFEVTASGDPSRFVAPGSREIAAFVTVEPWVVESSNFWSTRFDQVLFTVSQ